MYKYLYANLQNVLIKSIFAFVIAALLFQITFVFLDLTGNTNTLDKISSWYFQKFDGRFQQIPATTQQQSVFINPVVNSVKIGPMTGNKNLAFGVKNIIEEIVQDKGYDLTTKENADLSINTDIVYMDQKQISTNVSIFHKDENKVVIRMEGKLLDKKGKVIKKELVTDESSEISTSTLLISESGEFNSTVMRNAVKKTCTLLISKLLE
jgi:hypothetical protein